MISLTLNDLQKISGSSVLYPKEGEIFDGPVRGISIDTRTLQPREVFWAIKGDTFDGHWYVNEAENKGAVAAVVEKKKAKLLPRLNIPLILVKNTLKSLQQFSAWHRARFNIPVIALTGTNGKTTTKEMIAWILQTKYSIHKTIGNLNNHIGTPLTLLRLNSKHDISVIELGTNHPGEIRLLSTLVTPTSAMITNIGRGHLEFFSNIDGVAREKLSLFKAVRRSGTIYLNFDDTKLSEARIRRKNMWSYSLEKRKISRVKGRLIGLSDEGFGVWELNGKTKIRMRVPGIQNVHNALAASAVGLSFDIEEKIIKAALEDYNAYDKRMQIIKNKHSLIINDSYNANPDSFGPALKTLVHLAKGKNRRKIVVVGDMLELGKNSNQLHQELFNQLMQYKVEGIFTYGPQCQIAADFIRQKGLENVYSFSTHEELAKKLTQYLKSGDIILLKGSRGMQMERVLAYL